MKTEVEDIIKWIDNTLDESRVSRVEKAVMSDKNLQQIADKIRASQLPYGEAYEQQAVPDVPDSLRTKIQALQTLPAQGAEVGNLEKQNPPTGKAHNSTFKMIGIAASVMLVALVGYLAGANVANQAPEMSVSTDTPTSDAFARTVAAYQQYYVRETLSGSVAPDVGKVTERLADQTGMQVVIPEFEGYQFLRAQRLSVDGNLLLQLLYLGPEGGPLALCYIATDESGAGSVQSDGTVATILQMHHGLNTAEWWHKGHRFALVSDVPEEELVELSHSTRRQWSI